jgi:hypothetical protein
MMTESEIIEAIGKYANTPLHMKELWIKTYPTVAMDMLDYLINTTKNI